MKVLVVGGGGMLGHKLVQVFEDEFDVFTTVRKPAAEYERFGIFDAERTLGGINVLDATDLRRVFETVRPDVTVNAVGLIKQLPASADVVEALSINAIFPQRLAALTREFGSRLITIGTDCVFSGKKGNYSEDDQPDAGDLYGQSKHLGEVIGPGCLTLRTSIIGRELETTHGLVEWFLASAGGRVEGYTEAIFSGLTTQGLGELLVFVIRDCRDLDGLYHVSTEPISKYDLLGSLKEAYGLDVEIVPTKHGGRVDRSLNSARFREATGFAPSSLAEMIDRMARDTTPYDKWR